MKIIRDRLRKKKVICNLPCGQKDWENSQTDKVKIIINAKPNETKM